MEMPWTGSASAALLSSKAGMTAIRHLRISFSYAEVGCLIPAEFTTGVGLQT
jgi:hypothetical protein